MDDSPVDALRRKPNSSIRKLIDAMKARDVDGKLLSGAAAFAAMWRALPLLRPLGLAARWRPFLAVLEGGYLLFLRVRPRLQKLVRRLGLT